MQSTVDWMEGSKSLDTCPLYTSLDVSDNGWGGGGGYPASVSFPALIPHWGSLSLADPNLMYCVPLASEKNLFNPSSKLWTIAVMLSGVLNLDFFNFSDYGSVGSSTSESRLILPEINNLALAVTKSPPWSKPFKGV